MNKSNLPKDWIVCSSKSYPDKIYYFNKVTNKASWELPSVENQNETSSKENTKKRKLERDSEVPRPVTPDMMQEKERPVLQAKRRISLISQKTSNETPQMREIRERMLQKQEKLAKGLKSVPAKKDVPNKKLADNKTEIKNTDDQKNSKGNEVPESPSSSSGRQKRKLSEITKSPQRKAERRLTTVNLKINAKEESVSANSTRPAQETLTPQMRLLYEKLEERKAKNVASSKKSTSSSQSSSSNSSSVSRSSNISSSSSSTTSDSSMSVSNKASRIINNSEEPSNLLTKTPSRAVTTRRRSRVSDSNQADAPETVALSLPTLDEQLEPEDTKSKEKVSKIKQNETLTSARKTRRTLFTQSQEPDVNFKIASQSPATKCPKNIAKQRLDDIRLSLTLKNQLNESSTPKQVDLNNSRVSQPNVSFVVNEDAFMKDPGPEITLYSNAATRTKNIRDKVLNYQAFNAVDKRRLDDFDVEERDDQSVFDKLKDHRNDPYYEEMEWEPIEDEKITYEVQAVRSQLLTKSINHTNVLQENVLELSNNKKSDQALYIVIDTNVFLSNLNAVEEVRDTIFKTYGRPFIVVPWTVIQELDFIKDDKSATRPERLRIKARKAVRFLNQHFSSKHPRILGQTPEDVKKNKEIFETEIPDDEILQSCLQIRNSGRLVVLLSYDKNLGTKAMIYDIVTLGRDDPLEKIDFLSIENQADFSTASLSLNLDNSDKTALEEELLFAEDIFERAKNELRIFLTPVVVFEMRNLFGDGWERFTIIRPPWSTVDVLKCAIKHWIAAVSESFMRIAESILKELLDIINKPTAGGRKLRDVSYFLGRCSDLMQTLDQNKHPNLLDRMAAAMDALRARCIEETKRISEKNIRDEIGYEESIARQSERANVALNYFNKVYSFTREFCGVASEALDMPCTFSYEKTEENFTTNFVKDYQPVLAANLNHLLQLLSLAMEDINGLRPSHKAINILTEALLAFLPGKFNDSNTEITTLDLYYLLKTKQEVMKTGLSQLQELSQQFCRMASFRCK